MHSCNQPFNANQIERWAERGGIHYRQADDVLGGRTEIALGDPRYLAALDRLLGAACREPLVIMCAEGRPEDCHRTTDIAASLLAWFGVIVCSTLRDGSDEDVTGIFQRVPASRFAPEIRAMLETQLVLHSAG